MRPFSCLMVLCLLGGCAVIEPGHRGLLFSPSGGVKRDVLKPGYHALKALERVDDFDITYSTKRERLHTISAEGASLELVVSIIYRPVLEELYALDVEVGLNYYEEVLGPEFRTATRGVFARHSYLDVQRQNEKVEDEIEDEVRRRIRGKHIEVSSVTLESLHYAPEIAQVLQAKLVAEQEALRQKALLQAQAERARLEADAALRRKQDEHHLAEEESAVAKVRAETDAAVKLTQAQSEAQQITLLAKARAEEKRQAAAALTPLSVMMHGYDALEKLGSSGAAIMLGDWSKVPSFLFPPALLQRAGHTP